MGGDLRAALAVDIPKVGDGAGPPDDGPCPSQDFGYEDAENLEPDLTLADPAVMTP